MGSRDYRRREPKKPKKDVKKTVIPPVLPPSITVEVIRKGKKGPKEEEEE